MHTRVGNSQKAIFLLVSKKVLTVICIDHHLNWVLKDL